MKTENSIKLTGRVTNDAKINQFATASVARFGLAISRKETINGEEKRVTGFLDFEAWRKNENAADFDTLKKGQLITVEGYYKPDSYEKDGKTHSVVVRTVTKWNIVQFENKKEA